MPFGSVLAEEPKLAEFAVADPEFGHKSAVSEKQRSFFLSGITAYFAKLAQSPKTACYNLSLSHAGC